MAPFPPPPLPWLPKLLISLIIDVIGVLSYVIPVFGEASDTAWAPVSSFLVYRLYGSAAWAGVAFFEELLPFTDITPTATLAWVNENMWALDAVPGLAAFVRDRRFWNPREA